MDLAVVEAEVVEEMSEEMVSSSGVVEADNVLRWRVVDGVAIGAVVRVVAGASDAADEVSDDVAAAANDVEVLLAEVLVGVDSGAEEGTDKVVDVSFWSGLSFAPGRWFPFPFPFPSPSAALFVGEPPFPPKPKPPRSPPTSPGLELSFESLPPGACEVTTSDRSALRPFWSSEDDIFRK